MESLELFTALTVGCAFLNLCNCDRVDDFLNGIGTLKGTLEALDLSVNRKLKYGNATLLLCKELVKLKTSKVVQPTIKDCLSFEELILCRWVCIVG